MNFIATRGWNFENQIFINRIVGVNVKPYKHVDAIFAINTPIFYSREGMEWKY